MLGTDSFPDKDCSITIPWQLSRSVKFHGFPDKHVACIYELTERLLDCNKTQQRNTTNCSISLIHWNVGILSRVKCKLNVQVNCCVSNYSYCRKQQKSPVQGDNIQNFTMMNTLLDRPASYDEWEKSLIDELLFVHMHSEHYGGINVTVDPIRKMAAFSRYCWLQKYDCSTQHTTTVSDDVSINLHNSFMLWFQWELFLIHIAQGILLTQFTKLDRTTPCPKN